MTAYSQNGFPASADRAAIGVKTFAVPGSAEILLPLRADVAPLLLSMAQWWDVHVEPLVAGWCWAYAFRAIRGQTSGYSNHASATAMDLNAPDHPLGVRGTVPASKRAPISAAARARGLRWGGDYTGRVDEMHFEIDVSPARALELVEKLQNGGDDVVTQADMNAIAAKVTAAVFGKRIDMQWKDPGGKPHVVPFGTVIAFEDRRQQLVSAQIAELRRVVVSGQTATQADLDEITARMDAAQEALENDLAAAAVQAMNEEGSTA